MDWQLLSKYRASLASHHAETTLANKPFVWSLAGKLYSAISHPVESLVHINKPFIAFDLDHTDRVARVAKVPAALDFRQENRHPVFAKPE